MRSLDASFQVLEADRLTSTPYDIKFLKDIENQVLCKKTLKAEDLKKFVNAIKVDYYFQASRGPGREKDVSGLLGPTPERFD